MKASASDLSQADEYVLVKDAVIRTGPRRRPKTNIDFIEEFSWEFYGVGYVKSVYG